MGCPYGLEKWSKGKEIGAPYFAADRRRLGKNLSDASIGVETALQASEERYRYTVALTHLIPWIASAHGDMTVFDVRGLEYTGLA